MGARTIKVRPIYGWGWVIDGQPRFEMPGPFTLELHRSEAGSWSGVVVDEDHEFACRVVQLTQRHVEWTGHVNIVVEPEISTTNQPSGGFGIMDLPQVG